MDKSHRFCEEQAKIKRTEKDGIFFSGDNL